ncbi:hypothetical protein [Rhodanobacter soli]
MEDRAKDEQTREPLDAASSVGQVAQAMATVGALVHQALHSDGMKTFMQAMARLGQFIRENQSEILSFGEALRNLPEKLQVGVTLLAQRGWFVDEEMGLSNISDSRTTAQDGALDQIDALMVAHFEQQLDKIEERLVAFAPPRARILRSVFGAVRRGDDDLAVPILLMQADGLCHDHGLGSFFIRDKKDRQIPIAMKRLLDNGARTSLLYSPVYRVLPLYMTANERDESFTGLNRHQVLHGESVDYGTHENSLRAASFLNCIALLLRDSKDPENGAIEVTDEGSNP